MALIELIDFDFEAGVMIWKLRDVGADHRVKIWNARFAGKPALASLYKGYMAGTFQKKGYFAHRVMWAAYHGQDIPQGMYIDHINGNRSDNRIANLRVVTKAENAKNAKMNRRNPSGFPGVSKRGDRWRARINDCGKIVQVGTFDTFDEAVTARKRAQSRIGFHENHGRAV